MTVSEYNRLVELGFIDYYTGCVNYSHSSPSLEKFKSVKPQVELIMMKQLVDDFDIRNCIIIIPVNTNYGINFLWDNRNIVDSHCTHAVTLRYKLHEMGMKEYDGKSLIENAQSSTAMFVIDNGVVYCSSGNYPSANPTKPMWITPNESITKPLENKSIFFSGFALKRIK